MSTEHHTGPFGESDEKIEGFFGGCVLGGKEVRFIMGIFLAFCLK